MAGIKISALPAVPSAQYTDLVAAVQGGVTYKESISQIATLFGIDPGTGILSLAHGGTNANLTPVPGGIAYSTASAFGFSAAGSSGQILQSGGASTPTWTTSTYPATNAINTLLYASAANTMSALATANSSVLATDAGGVPSLVTALPGGLTVPDPVVTQGIASKHYVDQTALTGTTAYAASAATLGTVTQAGAGVGATLTNAGAQVVFALDGVNPPVNSIVLIKNTATGMTAANEGLYTVTNVGSGATNWVLTRATTYDSPSEINATGLIVIQNGTTLAGTAWYNANTIVTVDTTNFSYSQFGNIIFPITLAEGGTNAALTASNGGIFYSTASAGAILSGTATAGQALLSGASTTPVWSTPTYPSASGSGGKILRSDGTNNVYSTSTYSDTFATNNLLYSTPANSVKGLATANSSGLLTNGSGVPSWVTVTGTGAPVLANAPTLIAPVLGAASATSLTFTSTSGIIGTTTNDNAAAGSVGEFISSIIPFASRISVSSGVAQDVTSITITAGDWNVWGNVYCATTNAALTFATWVSSTSATLPDQSLYASIAASSTQNALTAPQRRFSVTVSTNIYLGGFQQLTAGTGTFCGGIYARRVR